MFFSLKNNFIRYIALLFEGSPSVSCCFWNCHVQKYHFGISHMSNMLSKQVRLPYFEARADWAMVIHEQMSSAQKPCWLMIVGYYPIQCIFFHHPIGASLFTQSVSWNELSDLNTQWIARMRQVSALKFIRVRKVFREMVEHIVLQLGSPSDLWFCLPRSNPVPRPWG